MEYFDEGSPQSLVRVFQFEVGFHLSPLALQFFRHCHLALALCQVKLQVFLLRVVSYLQSFPSLFAALQSFAVDPGGLTAFGRNGEQGGELGVFEGEGDAFGIGRGQFGLEGEREYVEILADGIEQAVFGFEGGDEGIQRHFGGGVFELEVVVLDELLELLGGAFLGARHTPFTNFRQSHQSIIRTAELILYIVDSQYFKVSTSHSHYGSQTSKQNDVCSAAEDIRGIAVGQQKGKEIYRLQEVIQYCIFNMRLFIHPLGFTPSLRRLRPLLHPDHSPPRFLAHLPLPAHSQQLIALLAQRLRIPAPLLLIRVILVGNTQERKIRLLAGREMSEYVHALGEEAESMGQYQLEVEVQLIESEQVGEVEAGEEGDVRLAEHTHALYCCSQVLLASLHEDDYLGFKTAVETFCKAGGANRLKILLNLYNPENGYCLLHLAIFYNKYDFVEGLLRDFGTLVNVNLRTADGWLPFQIALATRNKKAAQLLLTVGNFDVNYASPQGRTFFQLIDTINLELIEKTVKMSYINFEERGQGRGWGETGYEYVWGHARLLETEKQQLLAVMHERHYETHDQFVFDQLLHMSCRQFLPLAPRQYSPKKRAILAPNLKVVSGDLLRCRNPPLFSKFVFLSVNSYMGAIQQYEIGKGKTGSDREKLQQYQKVNHISLAEIESVGLLAEKDKSWYMKKEWFCFYLKEKRDNRHTFACTHEVTANQWVGEIQQAIDAWNTNPTPHQSSKISKNYVHLTDSEVKIQTVKKIAGTGFIELFSKRLSLCEVEPKPAVASHGDVPVAKSKSQYSAGRQPTVEGLASGLNLQYKDFKMLQMLGEGSFGQVFLVQCLRNGKFYALKTFQKKKIILSKQTKFVIAQVSILKQIMHPFIITLYFTFQTPNYIYLGLQYCQGKDLAKHINEEIVFPEQDVRLYAAEIVLALEYLHAIGIIYRDLKPENIMLGRDGHVLLVDFGLSKKTENNFAKTFCGSPAYLSPEMLEKKGVGPETDFFSLGVVIFELIFGEPPFYSQNIHMLYDNIQNGKLTFPNRIHPNAKLFLEALLQKQPKSRLGSDSIDSIKNHPYFQGINWDKLMKKEIAAPKRVLLQENEEDQSEEELIGMFHNDFDYSEENYRTNRFRNFSFVREEEFL